MKTVLLFSAAMALIPIMALVGGLAIPNAAVQAQPPRMQNADLDFAASGYLMPPGANPANAVRQAGMVGQMAGGPSQYGPTQFAPAGYAQPMPNQMGPSQAAPTGVAQVGYFSGGSACDSGCCGGGGGGCDSMGGGYGGPLGMGMMPGGCGGGSYQQCDPILTGGIVGKMRGESGCGSGGEQLSGLRHLCMFCRGGGCSACQSFRPGALLGALAALKPYTEGGLCAQRWYDLSAEAVILGHNSSGFGGGVTSLGIGGPIVLQGTDADATGLEAGMRLSAAIILGPGGNLEGTYMGGQEWSGSASVEDPGAGLFSFITDFGVNPGGGLDDTDQSLAQSISASSRFHSGEINYRRRTVGPYCRFQGSWLVGLRHLRFDNGLDYRAAGTLNNTAAANQLRFFSADTSTKNKFFGAQIGGDLWWNMTPGISFGVGAKGAWGQNDYWTGTNVRANSAGGLVTVQSDADDVTVMGEVEMKTAYRLSKDWTFRSAYYLIALDDASHADFDAAALRNIANGSATTLPDSIGSELSSLVIQGFSFGAEYTW